MRVQRLLGQVAMTIAYLGVANPGGAQTITTFDVPGAVWTFARAISSQGVIAGDYVDSDSQSHCFIRDANGEITTFDVPGGLINGVTGISPTGKVIGTYYTADTFRRHGFVRDTDGTITDIFVPGVASILAVSINAKGEVAGSYLVDSNGSLQSGFVRDVHGVYTTFAASEVASEIFPYGMNARGMIVGEYVNYGIRNELGFAQSRGFIRDTDGTMTTFQVGEDASHATSINAAGVVTGWYYLRVSPRDPQQPKHGFILDTRGNVTSFDALTPPKIGSTFPVKINSAGVVAGIASEVEGFHFHYHGFVRDAQGNTTIFDPPDSLETEVLDINARGDIVGYYNDGVAQFKWHGFVRSK